MASASCSETTAWEYCTVECAEVDTIELPEIDCSLLTTLLEESEAEGRETLQGFYPHSPTTTASDFDDCCLEEDMLSQAQEQYRSSTSASMDVDDDAAAFFGWVDHMDVVVPSSLGEWFVGADHQVGMMDYPLCSYYCDDDDDDHVRVEDGYSPLWQ